jgi:mono/diheme cytochrome c family protein
MVCHSRAANWVLGLTELQMNKVHDYGGAKDNQLRTLEHIGVLKGNGSAIASALRAEFKRQGKDEKEITEHVKQYTALPEHRAAPLATFIDSPLGLQRRLVDPYDPRQDLTLRARSYLHSHCAQCHVEAGGGNSQIDLQFSIPLDKMKLIDVKPLHDAFGLADARLIAPGKPESSVLLHRMACRGRGQMPPLATSLVDQQAVDMLREWVNKMKPAPAQP